MLKPRQKLGKYRIEQRLANGGFAAVYKALDTIEGARVALKIPYPTLLKDDVMKEIRSEVRMLVRLEHPNVLPLKDANIIDGQFVLVFPLGERSLGDRLKRRMSLRTAVDFAEQMLEAVAYAHRQRIIHCDIKPDNFIIFPGNRLRLADFGIAKVAQRTIRASGSGTVGHMAPEQAMGKPSMRSDVFALGLVFYRMLTGHLPEWPFHWPPPGYQKLRGRVHPDVIAFLRRSLEINPRKRFRDANQMLAAFRTLKPRALRYAAARSRRRAAR